MHATIDACVRATSQGTLKEPDVGERNPTASGPTARYLYVPRLSRTFQEDVFAGINDFCEHGTEPGRSRHVFVRRLMPGPMS